MAETMVETPPVAPASVACPCCGQALGCVNVLYRHWGYCYRCHSWQAASPQARREWHPDAARQRRAEAWSEMLDCLAAERRGCRAKGA